MSQAADFIAQGTATAFDPYQIFSVKWWLQHLSDAYNDNPGHMVIEFICVGIIIWLLFKSPPKKNKMSEKSRERLLQDWIKNGPEPLVPDSMPTEPVEKLVVSRHVGTKVDILQTVDGVETEKKDCVNFASYDYLNFSCKPEIRKVCKEIIETYGVGSCGPRGFYGTMDVHLELEAAIPKYFGRDDEDRSIIFADSIALAPSVICAFAVKEDIIIMDEGCNYLIKQGVRLARSNVVMFNHNDMASLENILATKQQQDQNSNAKLTRRYIIVEGVYHNRGDICPLPRVVKLAKQYKYRIMIDDTHGLGTLHPQGVVKYFNQEWDDIDVYFAGLDTVLASTGGFCFGSPEVINHQILSASGYVFSASSPPFQCKAAEKVLEILKEGTDGASLDDPSSGALAAKADQGLPKRIFQSGRSLTNPLVTKLQANVAYFREKLDGIINKSVANPLEMGMSSTGDENTDSPLIHLRVPNHFIERRLLGNSKGRGSAKLNATHEFVRGVVDKVLEDGFVVTTSHRHVHEREDLVTSLKICINVEHTQDELERLAKSVAKHWRDGLETPVAG